MKYIYLLSALAISTPLYPVAKTCDAKPKRKAAPSKKTEQKKETPAIQTIVVNHGQQFVITLKSNPSTGYDWHFKEPLDAKHLQLIKESYKPAQGKKAALIGAPGKKSFSLKASGKGRIRLTLQYKRIWEDAAPAEEKQYIIDIK